ncbi:ABC transporter ATP-binding protein [Nocardioides seonyuensis]|uniref:ABC transporter ATP-binding protein n=1 Tax=Nocardioides seonyuensis TaxID=2518371 RepID=A0A4P7IHK7_9ACTN|nr:ABC transporter ATP-binding protein [Nocardioides seonyuensis]QBX56826.1 ABC transporter ATP-binding protein [Nocardioides seonyuensis]
MTTTARHTTQLVTASRLTKRFGPLAAVDEVDLSVTGGIVGLLGPNGAGKTTLLRILATVLAPDAGSVSMLGLDPVSPSQRTEIRRRLGYLPQAPKLYGGFTPLEMVDYVAVLKEHTDRAWRRRETRDALEALGLGDKMHRRIRTLSGGMQQRVALAAAMIGSPELLVLDEPATGLDPEQRIALRSVLAGSAREGTVLLSTHNTAEVAALCQQVLVMDRGRICWSGTPAELAGAAQGRVWESESEEPTAVRSWVTGPGNRRHVGDPPAGAALVPATVDDGYLLVTRLSR